MSITAVEAASPGFLTVYPARTQRPTVANVNVDAGQTLATGTIANSSPAGTSVFTLGTAHLVVDVTGWFLTPSESGAVEESASPTPAPVGDDQRRRHLRPLEPVHQHRRVRELRRRTAGRP
jgi:hypothetical protein